MKKIEKAVVVIKNVEYAFLKPSAVELIEIEDKCIGVDGEIDNVLYNNLMVKLVDAKLKADDLIVFNKQNIELSSGDILSLPEVGYEAWANVIGKMEKFSRVEMAKHAIKASGVSGDISLSGFKYEDIDKLAMAFFSLYDASELKRVVDEIATFCFS